MEDNFELNFSIMDFQAILSPEGSIIIVGIGSDDWIYQYQGEDGTWNR